MTEVFTHWYLRIPVFAVFEVFEVFEVFTVTTVVTAVFAVLAAVFSRSFQQRLQQQFSRCSQQLQQNQLFIFIRLQILIG